MCYAFLRGFPTLPAVSALPCICCVTMPSPLRVTQANELIEVKKQQLAEARVWRQQQEEYEVRLLMLVMFSSPGAHKHGLSVVVCMCRLAKRCSRRGVRCGCCRESVNCTFFWQEEATIEGFQSRITIGGFPTSRPSGG
jgi:hypothetical protein